MLQIATDDLTRWQNRDHGAGLHLAGDPGCGVADNACASSGLLYGDGEHQHVAVNAIGCFTVFIYTFIRYSGR
jgi:hypothetical protein